MRAYSTDLRQRVVAAVERGMTQTDVATTFGVSLSTIKRLIARRRRDHADQFAAKIPGGRRRSIDATLHAALWAQLAANRDATLATHTQLWNETQGTALSQWTLGRAIRHLGWTRKKRRWVPPSGTSTREPCTVRG